MPRPNRLLTAETAVIKSHDRSSGFALLEVLIASTLFALLMSSAWLIAIHTVKTLYRNQRLHQHDTSLAPLNIDDCRFSREGVGLCTRGEHTSVIVGEGT